MTTGNVSKPGSKPLGPGAVGLREEAIDRHGEALPDGVELARQAFRKAPHALEAHIALISALLAAGEARGAADLAGDMRRKWSTSQLAIALQTTAWRMLGDRRYGETCDYRTLVHMRVLGSETQREMAGVAATLESGKASRGQLSAEINDAIAEMLASLGRGDDPVRSRNRGAFSVQGIALGSPTVDQVREGAWLSGVVCTGAGGRIRFGRPGVETCPALDADHEIETQAGLLVLFPSFLWLGVELSAHKPAIVFDLAPAVVELPEHD